MKRILIILISTTLLLFILVACSKTNTYETISITEAPTEKETVAEYHTSLNWEIVSTQSYLRESKECNAWRVYISDNKYSVKKGDIRDLYMELLQTQDPADEYYYHTVWMFFDRTKADGSGIADISIEQIVGGSHDAEVKLDGKKFIITQNGVISPSVDVN